MAASPKPTDGIRPPPPKPAPHPSQLQFIDPFMYEQYLENNRRLQNDEDYQKMMEARRQELLKEREKEKQQIKTTNIETVKKAAVTIGLIAVAATFLKFL